MQCDSPKQEKVHTLLMSLPEFSHPKGNLEQQCAYARSQMKVLLCGEDAGKGQREEEGPSLSGLTS